MWKRGREAWNKIDLIDEQYPESPQLPDNKPGNICMISAMTGQGVDDLVQMIAQNLSQNHETDEVKLSLSDGKRLAWLHENGHVLETEQSADDLILAVKMSKRNWGRFHAL